VSGRDDKSARLGASHLGREDRARGSWGGRIGDSGANEKVFSFWLCDDRVCVMNYER
jgi:hypothetical protein